MGDFNNKLGAGDKIQYIGTLRLGIITDTGDLLEKFAEDSELVVTALFQLPHRKLYM